MTEQDLNTENPDPKPRRKRRFRGVWTFLSTFFLAIFLGLVVLSLSGRTISAPQWVVRKVETQINEGFQAGRIHIGHAEFQVSRAGLPQAALRNMGVFDANGAEIARLNSVSAGFSPMQFLRGQMKPEILRLRGAEITLRRRRDGQFAVSFGAGSGTTSEFPDLLDVLDAAFDNAPLDQVTSLAADGLTISIEDARSGRFWQVTDGQIDVRRGDTGLDISVIFEVFNGTEELAEIVVGIITNNTNSHATIGTSFKNATADDIAAQGAALSFLAVLDAPISGSMRAVLDNSGKLENLAGTLAIAAGALKPTSDVEPLEFQSARTYFAFDPAQQKLEFSEVSLESPVINLKASGHAYLRDFTDGWPAALIGQFSLSEMMSQPADLYNSPITMSGGAADFRLRLNPFLIDVGQVVVIGEEETFVASGRFQPRGNGWDMGGEMAIDTISRDRILELWPVPVIPNTRKWIAKSLSQAAFSDVRLATRVGADGAMKRLVSWQFDDATLRYMASQPPLENASGYGTIDGNALTLIFEQGTISAPLGEPIDMAGSVVRIPDVTAIPAVAELHLNGTSEISAVLSLMDLEPFKVLRNASFGPDVSEGRTDFEALVSFPLKRKIEFSDVTYSLDAGLRNVVSRNLVPGRTITGQSLQFHADNGGLEISGPAMLGQVNGNMIWRQIQGADHAGTSTVTGTVELSQVFVEEFDIGLPDGSVRGRGIGQFEIFLETDKAPRFTLGSDLNRMGIRIPQVGWSKPKNATGKLWVAGRLGARPDVTSLELKSSGLNAQGGRVNFNADGTMRNVRFERVRLAEWLDAPVTFKSRANASPAVTINGGMLDIRKTAFGGGSGASGASSTGGGNPITLALDRVIVSEGISLTHFQGDLDSSGGMSGTFTARINGKVPISGSLAPVKQGTSVQINSNDGGAVLRDSGIVEYAKGGSLDLSLIPTSRPGVYEGELRIKNTRVKNAPGMTDLLSALSIVGLLEQMDGGGIPFTTMDADFRLSPTEVRLDRSSAVGASLGVTLDGVYDLTTSQMRMQGVVSPLYFLNGIGEILTRKGEGLFGFSYTLTGTSDAPNVKVNPLSILTPGLLRDLFREPDPETN